METSQEAVKSFTVKLMDYNLAKELKDVGFPQYVEESPNGRRYYFIREDDLSFVHQGGPDTTHIDNAYDEGDIMLAPSLEELIEACGEGNFFLEKTFETAPSGLDMMQVWVAQSGMTEGRNPTPVGAVARLWLALNKK